MSLRAVVQSMGAAFEAAETIDFAAERIDHAASRIAKLGDELRAARPEEQARIARDFAAAILSGPGVPEALQVLAGAPGAIERIVALVKES